MFNDRKRASKGVKNGPRVEHSSNFLRKIKLLVNEKFTTGNFRMKRQR